MDEIFICGAQEVSIYNTDTRECTHRINIQSLEEINEDYLRILNWYNSSTDEGKFVEETNELLITSVAGMFLVYNLESYNSNFIGWYPGLHSVEPIGEFYAIAVSTELRFQSEHRFAANPY